MHRLLSALLLFLQPFLKAAVMTESVKKLYDGTLRIFLVLLHDFPEFLSDFHLSLCDIVPMNCIQLRNLILSAFPKTMQLPDPFTPNLSMALLPESQHSPRIFTDYVSPISSIRNHLDSFMMTRQPAELPSRLHTILMSTSPGGTYNVPLVTSLVVYVASLAVLQTQQHKVPLASSPVLDLYKQLAMSLDCEGRYILFNIMANQLRYPNSHTNLFSFVLLHLFATAADESFQEQITRVLLERLIVQRPHPWGLLITFTELLKAPTYEFCTKGFTRTVPEIEQMLHSIGKSCMGPSAMNTIRQQQNVSESSPSTDTAVAAT